MPYGAIEPAEAGPLVDGEDALDKQRARLWDQGLTGLTKVGVDLSKLIDSIHDLEEVELDRKAMDDGTVQDSRREYWADHLYAYSVCVIVAVVLIVMLQLVNAYSRVSGRWSRAFEFAIALLLCIFKILSFNASNEFHKIAANRVTVPPVAPTNGIMLGTV
ncbi:hypothetical protein BV898_05982 [Hypsibius exemplaris]|uniref:Uncharacterized protein n=1 Tax=Hypsibius exemplaris TaxID=2072580 RepID=A0A1W0WXQ3_HYPEX|nr:hypothetical protein BV898_05982 [Hypsibius exemplaris]